jgi:very-short-patch-repair endonuclease
MKDTSDANDADIFATRDLRARGATRRDLSSAVEDGSLIRIRQGLYARPIALEATHAARHGGVLACASAAQAHQLWTMESSELHVGLSPHHQAYTHFGCDQVVIPHWDQPVEERRGWNLTPILPALAQLGECQGEEALLTALESALFLEKTEARLAKSTLIRSVKSALWPAIDFAEATSESGLETLIRWRLHKLGIRAVSQVDVPNVGRVDFIIGDRLIIEVDGREHHAGRDDFGRDRRRDTSATILGYVTLRFSYAQIMHDWAQVEGAILRSLAQNDHVSRAGLRMREPTPR